eukprot:scaffold649091_cov37-Prasinocladus_malaysianus.AAC.1
MQVSALSPNNPPTIPHQFGLPFKMTAMSLSLFKLFTYMCDIRSLSQFPSSTAATKQTKKQLCQMQAESDFVLLLQLRPGGRAYLY